MSAPETVSWSDLRDDAIVAFESFPPVNDEAPLMESFERSPSATRRAFENTRDRFKAGKVRAPWHIWKLECQTGRDIVVDAGPDRAKCVGRAEQWIRAAGAHFDVWAEVDDELFGERGRLKPWASDTVLRQRMESLWLELQKEAT